MRQHIERLVTCFCYLVVLSSTSSIYSLEFDPDRPLYLSDYRSYRAANICSVLGQLDQSKPTTLFIHGRGNEPKKSLKGGTLVTGKAVQFLERDYSINVVMFNWQSKARGKDREEPLSRMDASIPALWETLSKLSSCSAEVRQSYPLTMLVHSMGSILLEKTIDRHGWPEQTIFDSILLSASDSDAHAHKAWVDKLAGWERVYITLNEDDKVLRRARDGRSKSETPLGLGGLADYSLKANYIELSGLGKKNGGKNKTHTFFKKKSMKSQVNVCRLIDNILTSQSPSRIALRDESELSVIKPGFQRDSKDPCFSEE